MGMKLIEIFTQHYMDSRSKYLYFTISNFASTMPYSGIGLAIGLVSGAKMYVKQGAIIFVGGGPLNPARMLPGRGITLGNVIFIDKTRRIREEPGLIAHELTHVKQYRTYGAFFGPLYVGQVITYGYYKSPFEKQARSIEEDYNNEWIKTGERPPLPGPYAHNDFSDITTVSPEIRSSEINLRSVLIVNFAGGL